MKKILKMTLVVFLTTSILNAKDLLLVDVSGSLDTFQIRPKVISVVKSYLETSNDVLAFSDNVFPPILNAKDLRFGGGTAISKALSHAKDYSFTILLTDGRPIDKKATIKEAQRLKANGTRICTVYITSDKKSIPNVLKTISDEIFTTSEIEQVFELCNSNVRKKLIGQTALKIQINPNKYDF